MRESVVYFVSIPLANAIKVGTTRDLESRLRSHQCSNPHPIKLLLTVAGSHVEESRIHRRFHAERLQGEWFKGDGALAAFVSSLSTMTPAEQKAAIGSGPPPLSDADRMWNYEHEEKIRGACFAFIREQGVENTVALLNFVWGPMGRPVTAKLIEGVLAKENYFRSEWLISFCSWSGEVNEAVRAMVESAKERRR